MITPKQGINWLLLLCFIPICYGQKERIKIDSLLYEFSKDESKVNALNESVDLLLFIDANLANIYGKKALNVSRSIFNEEEEIRSLRLLVEVNLKLDSLEAAFRYSSELNQLTESSNTPYARAAYYFSEGVIHFHLSEYPRAADNLFKALQDYKDKVHGNEKCKTLNYIGRSYYDQKIYDKALEYYELALICSEQNNYFMGVSAGMNNIGAVLNTKGLYEDAKSNFLKAIKLNTQCNNEHWLAINYGNLGYMELKLGDTLKCLEWYQKSIELADQIDFYKMKSKAMYNLGSLYYKTEALDSAINILKKAFQISKDQKCYPENMSISSKLHDIYISLEDTSQAYIYEIENKLVREAHFNREDLAQIYDAEMRYNLELEKNHRRIELIKNRFRNLAVILLLILINIVVLLFYHRRGKNLYKAKQKELLVNQELMLKNKELASKTMYLVQKNNMIIGISEELSSLLDSISNDDIFTKINQLSKRLKSNSNEEVWKEFEVYFQNVYPDFYVRLLDKYPTITKSELKLCAFLRMNMSTKEISSITGQKTSSLEVARSRLRKKLGLVNTDTSFTTFLSKI